ncbi:Type II restriction endonuclease [Lactococcus lactis subsp. lactis]|uniref:Type II restriction endonuclease n=1 Tax=Lactococcus lactis subsp. lactis TaxID=1360 RepID=A0A0V8EWP8_LACLL|nr:Type II restriction endonuclease [Lactococcus lactis subsp. lactis]
MNKVVTDTFQSFSSLLFGNSSYKLSNKLYVDFPEFENRVSKAEKKSIGSNIFERFSEVFFDEKPGDGKEYIQIYGRENSSRIFKWIKREYVENHDNLEKWKVFVPGANGSGALGETLSTPLIGSPLIGGTQTFISFGAFDDSLEAENVLKYLKTKFARTMLGTLKITQNNKTKEVWKNVPLQDFTSDSDIDWTKSIPEIDQQLYAKYKLDEKEISFIEEKVKAMD